MSDPMERLGRAGIELGRMLANIEHAQAAITEATGNFQHAAARKAAVEANHPDMSIDDKATLAEANNAMLASYIRAAGNFRTVLQAGIDQYMATLEEITSE